MLFEEVGVLGMVIFGGICFLKEEGRGGFWGDGGFWRDSF